VRRGSYLAYRESLADTHGKSKEAVQRREIPASPAPRWRALPVEEMKLEETLRAFGELVEEGKVRYVRASFDVVVVGVFAGAPQSCSIC